jgi:hypothetical protein
MPGKDHDAVVISGGSAGAVHAAGLSALGVARGQFDRHPDWAAHPDIARQQLHRSPRMTPRIQLLSARPEAATSTVNRQQPGCRTDGATPRRSR